jgi:O-acetylhomoserine/O-acetylserine sulfhydrylase-like pyridoxal-dependent enzyme
LDLKPGKYTPGSARTDHRRTRGPDFQTTSYVFEDPESAAAYFHLQNAGNTYSAS